MAAVAGLECIRCGAEYGADHYAEDCPACRPVARSNLVVRYAESIRGHRARPTSGDRSLWRYGDLLPVAADEAVSLGEGGSPLHKLTGAGGKLGLAQLYGKDESRNPTWSFKDRLACMAVSWAKANGAEMIVSSSSGNAGAAAAAYAARAGLPCTIFTFKGAAGAMVTQMRAYGANLVEVQSKADRWTLMEHAVRNYGWFPTSPFFGPVVGSNPYGIEGYKTLAYEIAEGMNWDVPDWCILPVCYGDALVGMWRGFADMMAFGWTNRMPRMVAAEIYGSLSTSLDAGGDAPPDMPKTHDTVAVSIGATQGTHQALSILRASGGRAVKIANDEMVRWQRDLAAGDGLYVEATSAASLAAVERLRHDGCIGERDSVAVLLTASGLKDPDVTARAQEPPLQVSADMAEAVAQLQSAGVFPRQPTISRG